MIRLCVILNNPIHNKAKICEPLKSHFSAVFRIINILSAHIIKRQV